MSHAVRRFFAVFSFAFFLAVPLVSPAATVTLAGFAYAGDSKSIAARFPYTQQLETALRKSGNPLNKQVAQAVLAQKPQNFDLSVGALSELKGQDQVIVVALVVTEETVSVEPFGSYAKLLTQIRAQAMFFDFKSMTMLRAYPFRFTHLDVVDHMPSPAEVDQRVRLVYFGDQSKPGIITRFASALNTAVVPNNVPRFLQVTKVTLGDEARAGLSDKLKSAPGVAETWAADLFSEALSSKTGVPLLPYSKGYAVGNVMSMRIADGDVFNLKIPEPDYTITLDIPRFRRIKSGESAAGTSYIYGAYAHLKLEEPVSGKVYLESDFKNGEVKAVPASQTVIDDFPAYYDALNGLFNKLGDNIGGKPSDWLQTAASEKNIQKQINTTQELLKSCK